MISRTLRRISLAGLMSSGALGLATIPATSASAGPVIVTKTQTKTVDAQCKYPILGVEPLSLRVSVTGPSVIEPGSVNEPLSVEIVAAPGGDFGPGLALIDDLASFEGSISLATSVTAPDGGVTTAKVRVAIAPKPIDLVTGTAEFAGAGSLALGKFDETGTVSIGLDGLAMNLLARDSLGDPILLPRVSRDINGVLVVDTDSDTSTFDVSCRLEPAQDTTLATFPVETEPECNCGPPSRPTNLVGTPSQTSVALSWSASTDPDGIVVGYNVYRDGVKVTTVTGTSAVVGGLTPDTSYEFKVESIDDDGGTYASAPLFVTTRSDVDPLPSKISTELRGNVALKTLVKGSLPLRGRLDAQVSASGEITGDLSLNDALGRLTALGFLPVTAKFGFVPSGRLTGQYVGDGLRTTSLVRIKVKEVKLFGAIPLAGGNNCQTKQLTELNLSGQYFTVDAPLGNGLSGTFAMSDLNGCGALNGLVSPFTAGSGNTMWLGQWPVPPPSA